MKKTTLQEWASLLKNGTFEKVSFTPIGCKWVYKVKRNPDGTSRNKVRLIIKGYEQVEGIDFKETYAPVSKLTTLRFLLDQAAQYDWPVFHMDTIAASPIPKIGKDNIYLAMPPGIEWIDKRLNPTSIVRLPKALYGLKQAS